MSYDQDPGLARWFSISMWGVASLYAIGLLAQLSWGASASVPDGRDPFNQLPWFVYALEVGVLLVTTSVAAARHRGSRMAVTVSFVGAILLLPICPWTVLSLVWLIKESRREREWARSVTVA
jgi:hypothetical protein